MARIIENRSANFYWATVLAQFSSKRIHLRHRVFLRLSCVYRVHVVCNEKKKKKEKKALYFRWIRLSAKNFFTRATFTCNLLRGSITFHYRSFVNKGSIRASRHLCKILRRDTRNIRPCPFFLLRPPPYSKKYPLYCVIKKSISFILYFLIFSRDIYIYSRNISERKFIFLFR